LSPPLPTASCPSEKSAPRKKRRTATEKRKEEAEAIQAVDKACGNDVGNLLRRWHCEKKGCFNYSKACYIIDTDHIPLNSSDLTSWNTAIKYERATLEVPSGPLFSAFISKRKSIKPTKLITSTPPPPPLPSVYRPYTFSQHPLIPPPLASPYYYGNCLPPALPIQPQPATPSRLRAPARPAIMPAQNSSPVTSDTDPTGLLLEYIEWHIQKKPFQEWQFREAFRILQEQCYDMEGIRKLQDYNWQELAIPLGLGTRLSRDIRAFY
jgi:hypothetical protein